MAAVVESEIELAETPDYTDPTVRRKSKFSGVWHYFIQTDKTRAVCKMCRQTYSYSDGSTSNLRKHLAKLHGIVPVSGKLSTPGQETTDLISLENVPADKYSTPTASKKVNKMNRNRPLTAIRQMHMKILQMICKNQRPLTILEDDGFIALMKLARPAYQIPTKDRLFNVLLPEVQSIIELKGKRVLEEVVAVSLTANTWTNSDGEAYLSLQAHFMDKKWSKRNLMLGIQKLPDQTAISVSQVIEEMVRHWGLEHKVQCFVSPDSPVMKAVAGLLRYRWLPYFSQSVNTVIENAYQTADFKPIVSKINSIAIYFASNPRANTKLKELLMTLNKPYVKLTTENTGTWFSTFDMLERFVDQSDAIRATLNELGSPVNFPSEEDLLALQHVVAMLLLFKQANLRMIAPGTLNSPCETIYVAGSLLHEIQRFISDHQSIASAVHSFGQSLVKSMTSHGFGKFHEEKHLALATVLNPATKDYGFLDEGSLENAAKWLAEAASKLPVVSIEDADDHEMPVEVTGSNGEVWKDVEFQVIFNNTEKVTAEAKEEVQQYLAQASLQHDEDPLSWWSSNEQIFKRLSIIAKQVLCLQVCEQEPATLKKQKIAGIDPEMASSIAFVGSNWSFAEGK